MSRRTALVIAISSAAAAITVAAGVLLTSGAGNAANSAAASTDRASQTIDVQASGALGTEIGAGAQTAGTPSSHLTRQGVDWSAVFEIAVPSLVTVIGSDGYGGAGFFVSRNGHVITNFHIVDEATTFVVYTHDGQERNARLIAKDLGNDLALLKIDPTGIDIVLPKYAPLDDLRVGQPVAALGTPFGLTNSLSVGIISGLSRQRISGNDTYEPIRNMIQTDAAMNAGNSGGMLVDAQGRVIGIPTQIATENNLITDLVTVSSGVGFAVSADAMLRALPTLLTGKDYQRSFLGVAVSQRTEPLTVTGVACGTAADRAGMRDGDIILRINGQPTPTLSDMLDALFETKPGDAITIAVRRGQRTMTLETVTSAYPNTAPRFGCG